MHIVARLCLLVVGWFVTATFLFLVFDWEVPGKDKSNAFAAIIGATLIWLIIIGIVYW